MRLATLILPTTGNDGTDHTDTHAALRLTLIDAFGGFTVMTGDGGWRDDSGRVYLDPVAVYSVAMSETGENETRLESIARLYGHLAGQQCVLVAHASGAVAFVDSSVNVMGSVA